VLAERISEARARVLAARLLPDVLAAAGVERPGGDVEAQVRRALEELDDPRVGLAVDGSGAREASDELRIETGVTGAAVINRSFRQSTERNFGFSLATSLASMLVLGVLMFWRFGVGLTAVAPSAVTLLLTLGLMGLTRTPIDPGTCMLASLSLGIGIDYAIHFLWRRRWRGLSMEATCRTVGPSIVFNAVEVASCFAVLFAASMVPLSRFGLLLTMAMLVAAAATFTLLPALAPAAALAGKGPQGSGAAEEASR
jgi:predicted RND superfamily exporter protein